MQRDDPGKKPASHPQSSNKVCVPLAEQRPNHASYACSSASSCLPVALHHLIHASSFALLENSEGRGDRCAAGPFSLHARGQGLTDTGTHLLPAWVPPCPAAGKAHYQVRDEDFWKNNFTSLKFALHIIIHPIMSWPAVVKRWVLLLIRSLKCCVCTGTGSVGKELITGMHKLIYPVVPELLCGCHMSLCWGDMSHQCHGDMSPHYCAAIMDVQLKALTTAVST